MKDFSNKTVIVTGAAMGLGLAAAEELANRGANLTLVDYNGEELEKVKANFETKYPDANTYRKSRCFPGRGSKELC